MNPNQNQNYLKTHANPYFQRNFQINQASSTKNCFHHASSLNQNLESQNDKLSSKICVKLSEAKENEDLESRYSTPIKKSRFNKIKCIPPPLTNREIIRKRNLIQTASQTPNLQNDINSQKKYYQTSGDYLEICSLNKQKEFFNQNLSGLSFELLSKAQNDPNFKQEFEHSNLFSKNHGENNHYFQEGLLTFSFTISEDNFSILFLIYSRNLK